MILIGSSRLGNQCLPIFLAVIVSIIISALMVDFNSPWFPPSTWFGGFHSPPPSHNQCLLLLFCYPLFWASPSFSIVIIKLKTPFADFFCVPQRKQKTPSLLYMKFTTLHPPLNFFTFFTFFKSCRTSRQTFILMYVLQAPSLFFSSYSKKVLER